MKNLTLNLDLNTENFPGTKLYTLLQGSSALSNLSMQLFIYATIILLKGPFTYLGNFMVNWIAY